MRTESEAKLFTDALSSFQLASEKAVAAEEAYRASHAAALLASEAKNEAARKAEADVKTSDLRIARDRAKVLRDVAEHMVVFLRGPS